MLDMRRIWEFVLLAFCGTIWFLLGMLSAIATPQIKFREEPQNHKHQNFLDEFDCILNARSPYIQCAVNPSEDCDKYIYLIGYRDWYNSNW